MRAFEPVSDTAPHVKLFEVQDDVPLVLDPRTRQLEPAMVTNPRTNELEPAMVLNEKTGRVEPAAVRVPG